MAERSTSARPSRQEKVEGATNGYADSQAREEQRERGDPLDTDDGRQVKRPSRPSYDG